MGEVLVDGVNGVKWVLDSASNDTVKFLSGGEDVGQPKSCSDQTGATYQVPVGKKLVCLSMMVQMGDATTNSGIVIYDATSVDTAAGTKVFAGRAHMTVDPTNFEINNVIPAYFEIPASHYLTVSPTAGNAYASFIGVETDA